MKKLIFLYVIIIAIALMLSLLYLQSIGQVGIIKVNSGASVFSSLFSKISSLFSTQSGGLHNDTAKSEIVDCVPLVSPKPDVVFQGFLGTMEITPEITKDATNPKSIMVKVHNSVPAKTLTIGIDGDTAHFSAQGVIDWGPKDPYSSAFKREASIDPKTHQRLFLPVQDYWVTLKIQYAIGASNAQNTGSYGWSTLGSIIKTDTQESKSRQAFYVGGHQLPDLQITRIANKTKAPFNTSMEVTPGDSFSLQIKTFDQPGTMDLVAHGFGMPALGATVEPAASRISAKANDTATLKLTPYAPVVMLRPAIENACGSNNPSTIEIPIVFNYKNLSADKFKLSLTALPAFDVAKHNSVDGSVSLLVPLGNATLAVPNIKFTVRAAYEDSPEEILKDIIFEPKAQTGFESDTKDLTPRGGDISLTTNKAGTALVKITAPALTEEKVKKSRIMLYATSSDIPGLAVQTELLINNIVREVKQKTFATGIAIGADQNIFYFNEGDVVHFQVWLKMSDGSKKKISNNVAWNVNGPIGSIDVSGTFTAKLDDSVSEEGSGIGTIKAVYIDEKGNSFSAKTSPFKVELAPPNENDTSG